MGLAPGFAEACVFAGDTARQVCVAGALGFGGGGSDASHCNIMAFNDSLNGWDTEVMAVSNIGSAEPRLAARGRGGRMRRMIYG